MIQSIYIKNFKAFEKTTILLDEHNIIIGENDSGKSTVLQALDIFFNQEKIEKVFVRNLGTPVEIGIRFKNSFYKKIYSGSTYKLNATEGDLENLDSLKYIYIPTGNYDVKQMIQQLSTAKVLENTPKELIEKLKNISQNSVEEVIEGINTDLIVLNKNKTNIIGEQKFNYDASLKFGITTNGISIESRGSGFQKNLLYALIIGNNYNNVILGIDEIENSFSMNNSKQMILKIHETIGQTIITTHSKQILEKKNDAKLIPLFSENNKSLIELLESLDDTKSKNYILVEGLYDLNWINKAVSLLGKSNEYYVLPGGGSGNIEHLKNQLESYNKKCFIIKDGDTNEKNSLQKDCIELYAPLNAINDLLDMNLQEVPKTKKDFFDKTIIPGKRNEDTVKEILSRNINKYLFYDNELVKEIAKILSN